MIDILISFLIGLFIGLPIGMILTGLCVASKNDIYDSNNSDNNQSMSKENNINNTEDI